MSVIRNPEVDQWLPVGSRGSIVPDTVVEPLMESVVLPFAVLILIGIHQQPLHRGSPC